MFLALVIQHSKRMRRTILSSVACPTLQYFPALSYKRHDFRNEVIEYKMYLLIFSVSFVWTILRIIQRDIVINVHISSRKVAVILVRSQWTLYFLGRFWKILKYQMGRASKVLEVGCKWVNWIQLARDRIQMRPCMDTVMKTHVP